MLQYAPTQHQSFFHLLGGSDRSQAATMILSPGQSTGGPSNRHARADQWLYVVSGTGQAVIENQTIDLVPGSLILIESTEAHEISAHGEDPLVTVNIYAPPVY